MPAKYSVGMEIAGVRDVKMMDRGFSFFGSRILKYVIL